MPARIYERDTDALFLRLLRSQPAIASRFVELAISRRIASAAEVNGQVRHPADAGSIDIIVRFRDGAG